MNILHIYNLIRNVISNLFISRVNYDHDNWELLSQQLLKDHTAINVINRAQIMDDALNLAKSDLLDYETALSVTGYLSKEVEYIPWASAFTGTTIYSETGIFFQFRSRICKQDVEKNTSIWGF